MDDESSMDDEEFDELIYKIFSSIKLEVIEKQKATNKYKGIFLILYFLLWIGLACKKGFVSRGCYLIRLCGGVKLGCVGQYYEMIDNLTSIKKLRRINEFVISFVHNSHSGVLINCSMT